MEFDSLLNEPYPLSQDQISSFREEGFVYLPAVFTTQLLEHYRKPLAEIVASENPLTKPLAERNEYDQAFTQIMNVWTRHESVRKLILNRRTAQIATSLLGTNGVRLWHDQALFKEAGGGKTPWHADQYYWPLSSDLSVTIWIPLQATTIDTGALQFAAGSHNADYGRHHSINSEGDERIESELAAAGLKIHARDFALGDASFHMGWTFHRAKPNPTQQDRGAITMIYIDRDMRVAKPQNSHQENDQKTWAPSCEVGDLINSPINPVLYERSRRLKEH